MARKLGGASNACGIFARMVSTEAKQNRSFGKFMSGDLASSRCVQCSSILMNLPFFEILQSSLMKSVLRLV